MWNFTELNCHHCFTRTLLATQILECLDFFLKEQKIGSGGYLVCCDPPNCSNHLLQACTKLLFCKVRFLMFLRIVTVLNYKGLIRDYVPLIFFIFKGYIGLDIESDSGQSCFMSNSALYHVFASGKISWTHPVVSISISTSNKNLF